jgi:hypothetical protein
MADEKKPETPPPAPLDSTEVKDADLEKVAGGGRESLECPTPDSGKACCSDRM